MAKLVGDVGSNTFFDDVPSCMAKLGGQVRINKFFDDVLTDVFGNTIALGFGCVYCRGREPRREADSFLVEFCGRSPGDLVKWLVKEPLEKVEVLENFT